MLRKILISLMVIFLMGNTLTAKNLYPARTDTNTINQLFTEYLNLRNSEPTEALQRLQDAILIARQINNEQKMALLHYHKGYLYRTLGIFNLAMNAHISALEYYEKTGNINEKSWLLIDIALVYLNSQKNYTMALNHFKKAEDNFKKIGNTIGLIVVNQDIGYAYSEIGKYNLALECFLEAAKLSWSIKEKRHEADCYALLGRAYLQMNDLKSSRSWYHRALKINQSISSTESLAKIYQDLSALELKQSETKRAFLYLDSALASFSVVDNKVGLASVYTQMSTIHASQKEYPQALDCAMKALELADKNQLFGQQLIILPAISEYYSRLNDAENSYSFLKRFYTLKESNSVKYAQQLEAEYTFQNDLQERHLQEEVDLKKKIIMVALSFGLLLLLALIGILSFKNLQLKESNQHLFNSSMQLHRKEQELAEIKRQDRLNRSLLKNEQNQILLNELLDLMDNQKIFLNSDLTLDELARKLNSNRTYISQLINDNFATNFSSYINEYRISEAKELFTNPLFKNLTIEAIAQKVGFNSKSSFNTAFKKVTGLTPSSFVEMNAMASRARLS